MKIIISRNDKLGDFILSIPVFKTVKKTYPESTVCALVSPLGRELAEHIPEIDEIIVDSGGSAWELSRQIRAFNPDTAITIFSTFRLGLAIFLAGVKNRIAPATKLAQIFYNKRKKQKRSSVKMREFEYNLELLKVFNSNIETDFKRPVLGISAKPYYSEKIVCFHIGFGGSSLGNISEDNYIALAKMVSEKEGFKPLYTFGPNEYDLKEKIEKKVDYEAIFYESKSGIIEFAKLISTAECFVATSTGTLQLAGALNIPTFGFFGDTLIASPKRWGTLNDESKQHNYTIYEDKTRQKEQMDRITADFKNFLKGLH